MLAISSCVITSSSDLAFWLEVLMNLLEKFELPLRLILGNCFYMALELLPIAFNHVSIHGASLRDD